MGRDALARVLAIPIAVSAVSGVVGLAVAPLASAPVVRLVVDGGGLEARTGLERDSALATAELVRAEVVGGGPVVLPGSVDGRAAFDERAVAHLEDVRVVLAGARLVTFGMLALLAGAALVVRRDALRRGLRAAGWALIALTAAAGVVASLAPEWLFARFHDLFFTSGTWTFPAGDLLIELFPPRFWVVSGVWWGVLVLGGAAALLAASRAVAASVVGKDV